MSASAASRSTCTSSSAKAPRRRPPSPPWEASSPRLPPRAERAAALGLAQVEEPLGDLSQQEELDAVGPLRHPGIQEGLVEHFKRPGAVAGASLWLASMNPIAFAVASSRPSSTARASSTLSSIRPMASCRPTMPL